MNIWWLLELGSVFILVLLSAMFPESFQLIITINPRLIVLIISGILLGCFYGYHNWRIFDRPFKDEIYKKVSPQIVKIEYDNNNILVKKTVQEDKMKKIEIHETYDRSSLNKQALVNSMWVHIVCGVAGAIAFYLLANNIFFNKHFFRLYKLNISDLFFFIIALLGYMGLLPRTMWFFASKGSIDILKSS